MSATLPILSLASLVLLSVLAKHLNYALTSTSLLFMTGALGTFFAVLFWMFG